jgi:hypothetical protein
MIFGWICGDWDEKKKLEVEASKDSTWSRNTLVEGIGREGFLLLRDSFLFLSQLVFQALELAQ